MYVRKSVRPVKCPNFLNPKDYKGKTWYKYILESRYSKAPDVTGWFQGTRQETLDYINTII